MKTIVDYLIKKQTYEHNVLGRDFILVLEDKVITLKYHGHEWWIATNKPGVEIEYIIQDTLEECGIEIRFCDECGKPFGEGFMMEDACWYICDDCFEAAMNAEYGEDKWRATDEEGSYGGFYEHLNDGDEWEDTGIFWTEWN